MTHRDGLTFYFMFTISFHIAVIATHYSLQTVLSELLTLLLHGPQTAIFSLIDWLRLGSRPYSPDAPRP